MASSEGLPAPQPGSDRALTAPRAVRFTRVLLCVQGILIVAVAVAGLATVAPGTSSLPNVIGVIAAAVVAVACGTTALRLGQGRRRAGTVAVALRVSARSGQEPDLPELRGRTPILRSCSMPCFSSCL